jgi:uncharacterized protein (TIGR02145 family)
MSISSKITILLFFLLSAGILNLTAQNSSIKVFVYDAQTNEPIEYAQVSVLKDGLVIDSAYTDINGIADLQISIVSVSETEGFPNNISLSKNYPNPFSDNTNVEMSVTAAQTVTASVYNVLGQLVASEQIHVSAGTYTFNLSLGHLPKGVYFLQTRGRESQTVKLTKMGNNIHYSGPLFSISTSSLPRNPAINKIAEDEFTLQAFKTQYIKYAKSINISGKGKIEFEVELSKDIISEPPNDEATLSDLTVDGKTLDGFSPGKLIYEIFLPSGTTDVPEIDATTKDPNAQMVITQAFSLPGTGSVVTTARDGESQLTYEINFAILPNKTVVDIDGNIYNTVQMGMMDEQGNITYREWTTENLKVTHYRNGDPILVYNNWSRTTMGPDHQYQGRFDISQGFPGSPIGTIGTGGTWYDAIHWKDFGSGTGFDTDITQAGGYPDGFLEALGDMVDRGVTQIDPAMHWFLLGLEGIAEYKGGMFRAAGAIPNSKYGAFGAAANLDPAGIAGLTTNEEVIDNYGRVYNWYAVSDPRGLCPTGWHVPSHEEWNQIERYIIYKVLEENGAGTHEQRIGITNDIVLSSGQRGSEYKEYNINLGGRIKTINAGGMEIGGTSGSKGNNYVTMLTERCEQKVKAHLTEGDRVRLASYYYPSHPEGIGVWPTLDNNPATVTNITTVNGDLRIYFDQSLPFDLPVMENSPENHLRTVYLILTSYANGDPAVPGEHPRWTQESSSNQQWINGGNSAFSGGGSSGLNLTPVGFLQLASRDPGWFPEQIWAYGIGVAVYWTSTGDEDGSPIVTGHDWTVQIPYTTIAATGARARQITVSDSGIMRRTMYRTDGCGVRCVKD